ncbi:PREDICTED: mitochondrial import receptor subunit TOM7 homolog, partial [Pterocles gutturalis]|uniref:mitochondrial import receptor subunit TOM7 homolog n=1 Tax=Pterocles gutturalis TaxID=240206 RepID=UPI0005294A3D
YFKLMIFLGFKRGADPGMPEPTIWRTSRWTEKVSEDMYIPEDEADTYTSCLNQLANDIGCTYNKMEFIWT